MKAVITDKISNLRLGKNDIQLLDTGELSPLAAHKDSCRTAPLTIHGGYLYQKQTAVTTVRKEYCLDIAVADSDLFKLVGGMGGAKPNSKIMRGPILGKEFLSALRVSVESKNKVGARGYPYDPPPRAHIYKI